MTSDLGDARLSFLFGLARGFVFDSILRKNARRIRRPSRNYSQPFHVRAFFISVCHRFVFYFRNALTGAI